MAKPYQITRERRYLGLPIGFGMLALSFFFAILFFSYSKLVLCLLADLCRAFCFIFLAATYYFSKEPSKNSKIIWDLTLGLLITALIVISVMMLFKPEFAISAQKYLRISSILFLTYIAIHTLKSHIDKPTPTTVWIPLAFIFLILSQFSFLFLYDSQTAIWTGYALRLVGLGFFLLIALKNFYSLRKPKTV
jgi:hypothetical protein